MDIKIFPYIYWEESSQLTFAYFSEGSTTNDRTQDTSAVQLLEMAKARLAKAR
jgi:hypothetical protein